MSEDALPVQGRLGKRKPFLQFSRDRHFHPPAKKKGGQGDTPGQTQGTTGHKSKLAGIVSNGMVIHTTTQMK